MITYNKETPILLLAQGRIETVRQIYNMLRQIEPNRLYLYYDAPENESEKNRHEQIRALFEKPEWKCSVKSFNSKKRLEESVAMLQAARRFFRYETEGIVLNGDSVPFPAFFAFCSCLLEKYRYDERIGHISGRDFLKTNHKSTTNDTYYFSKLVHTNGGWASWRRVWKDIDAQLKTFNAFKKQNIIDEIPTHKPFKFLLHHLDYLNENWESRYEYINLINSRLSVVPDMRQLPVQAYTFHDITHPVFMINPLRVELRLQEKKYDMPAVTSGQPESMAFLHKKVSLLYTEARRQMKIPRIIHQIYEGPTGPPADFLLLAESWKTNHPDWEYRLWNRKTMNAFLESTCPEFLPCYHSYPFDVQRWDAIRYLILYHIGGMYVDMDYESIRSMEVLLAASTCCMGMEPSLHNLPVYKKSHLIGNALMASVPRHPYMSAIIKELKAGTSVYCGEKDSTQVMETTGPLMVTRVYDRFKKKRDVTLLPADWVAPLTIRELWMLRSGRAQPDMLQRVDNSFAIHYFYNSWASQTAKGVFSNKDDNLRQGNADFIIGTGQD